MDLKLGYYSGILLWIPWGAEVGESGQRRVDGVGGAGRRGLESPLNEGVVGHSEQLLDMGSAAMKRTSKPAH